MINIFETFLPQLLRYPNPTDPLNGEAAALLMRDAEAYEKRVRGLSPPPRIVARPQTDPYRCAAEYVAKFAAGDKTKDDDDEDEDDEVSLVHHKTSRRLTMHCRTTTKQIITAEARKRTTWTFNPRPSPRLVARTITVPSPSSLVHRSVHSSPSSQYSTSLYLYSTSPVLSPFALCISNTIRILFLSFNTIDFAHYSHTSHRLPRSESTFLPGRCWGRATAEMLRAC